MKCFSLTGSIKEELNSSKSERILSFLFFYLKKRIIFVIGNKNIKIKI